MDGGADRPARENEHAGQGAVLLDVGGDTGALVVTTPPGMVGLEVEIMAATTARGRTRSAAARPRPHAQVISRPTASGPVASLVYAELAAGRYDLAVIGRPVAMTVSVEAGRVTTARWLSGERPGRA